MTEPADPGSTPQIEVIINAPPELVWQALRDPELLRRWHGWHYDKEGGLDEEIRVIYHTGATEDPDRFVLQLSDQDRFSLHPTPGGTIVRITRAPRSNEGEWAAYYDDITEGWQTFLEQLRFAVERHQLAQRRTAVFDETLAWRDAIDALGLSEVAVLPAGSPYRAPIATGEEISGQIWARPPNQLAITVDSYGDGLVILAEQPRGAHRPGGGTLMVLTAYGLDDTAYETVRARWSRWWANAGQ